jgi:hypothetical protein
VILKIKAFIYRFSDIFNIRIFLARREEYLYIKSLGEVSELEKDIHTGLWQAKHGFTTVWTYKQPLLRKFIIKVNHAFSFKEFDYDQLG